jgi:hypothetical protein
MRVVYLIILALICFNHYLTFLSYVPNIYEVFGLMNHSIQNEVVHHGSIPQIWWDDSIPHISTKQLTIRNEVVMD